MPDSWIIVRDSQPDENGGRSTAMANMSTCTGFKTWAEKIKREAGEKDGGGDDDDNH